MRVVIAIIAIFLLGYLAGVRRRQEKKKDLSTWGVLKDNIFKGGTK